MNKLLLALVVGIPLAGCTTHTIVEKAPPADATDTPADETTDETTPPAEVTPDPAAPTSKSKLPEDRCLDGQDMDAADIDISKCPELPSIPEDADMGKQSIDLGAWEIGTTAEGQTYKYGTLTGSGSDTRTLIYDGGNTKVNHENIECWAKGYYRLRKMLQTAPAEYVALHDAGFQYRFFQFQTDLRNGRTGFKEISSFEDHLVKWVTIVDADGKCEQPTMKEFRAYAKGELQARGIKLPDDTTSK